MRHPHQTATPAPLARPGGELRHAPRDGTDDFGDELIGGPLQTGDHDPYRQLVSDSVPSQGPDLTFGLDAFDPPDGDAGMGRWAERHHGHEGDPEPGGDKAERRGVFVGLEGVPWPEARPGAGQFNDQRK